MKIYDNEIYSFFWGAGLSWLVTYLNLTHERRIVAYIKSMLLTLALYHDVAEDQHRQIVFEELASDKEYWEIYCWARRVVKGDRLKIDPVTLASEAILCEKVFGLTRFHAARALNRTKPVSEIKKNLADVTAEFGDRFSN